MSGVAANYAPQEKRPREGIIGTSPERIQIGAVIQARKSNGDMPDPKDNAPTSNINLLAHDPRSQCKAKQRSIRPFRKSTDRVNGMRIPQGCLRSTIEDTLCQATAGDTEDVLERSSRSLSINSSVPSHSSQVACAISNKGRASGCCCLDKTAMSGPYSIRLPINSGDAARSSPKNVNRN